MLPCLRPHLAAMHALLRRVVNEAHAFGGALRAISTSSVCQMPEAALERDTLSAVLSEQLDQIRAAGTYKQERVITTAQAAQVGKSKQVLHAPRGTCH